MVLPILPLSQRDSRWSFQRLGTVNSTTIGSHGCVITSMCMLATYYNHPILPNQIDDILTDKGLYFDGNLFVNDSITKIFPDIKFDKVTWSETVPAPIAEIKKYLDAKKPVVVALINQGIRHYVLAVGYEGDQIIVNDPWMGDQVNIRDRWGDSASKILQVNFFSGPVPSRVTPTTPTGSTDSAISTTDQSRINLGVEIGVMEVQAIRSEILDLRRTRRSLEMDLLNSRQRILDLEQQSINFTDQTKIPLGNELGSMEVQAIRSEILDLRRIRADLEHKVNQLLQGGTSIDNSRLTALTNENSQLQRELSQARQEIEELEIEIDNLENKESKDEDLPSTSTKPSATFTDRLKSRKLILSVASALIAFLNSKMNLGLSTEQLLTIIGPLMAFVGVEGLADTVERVGLGTSPTTKVTIEK